MTKRTVHNFWFSPPRTQTHTRSGGRFRRKCCRKTAISAANWTRNFSLGHQALSHCSLSHSHSVCCNFSIATSELNPNESKCHTNVTCIDVCKPFGRRFVRLVAMTARSRPSPGSLAARRVSPKNTRSLATTRQPTFGETSDSCVVPRLFLNNSQPASLHCELCGNNNCSGARTVLLLFSCGLFVVYARSGGARASTGAHISSNVC